MQTSLRRRARHRRTGAARRRGGGGPARQAAIAVPLLLFSSFLVLGAIGFVGAVSAYAYYSRDLADPKDLLTKLTFDQQTVIYDRTGQVELARLGERKRELVSFDELPPELVDATTAIEDKDFWSNPGFDVGGFLSATIDTIRGRPRGGSTITQQLVRQRLLPESAFEGSVYERKIREIIQSIRLTQEFPGQDGKEQIITAYLNQNFYGNQSYGVKAAARAYFGKELNELTLAETAVLAAIPQSPVQFDLVKNAEAQCTVEVAPDSECPAAEVRLVVPPDSAVVQRRNKILELMETRSVLSSAAHTLQDYVAAMNEEVVLAPQGARPWKAAHFVWQVRHELGAILCGPENADTCEKVDTGGYRVVTTLDWNMQQVAEKWVYAAARSANQAHPEVSLEGLGIPKSEWKWLVALHGENMRNAASAVIDYRTGQVLAYVGSACYACPGTDPRFQPQFDVLADGWRQPGSAIKPVNYSIGLDDHTMTAATMFMDVVTNFGTKDQPFTPTDFDSLERGPVRMRSAIQSSLNVPAVKAGILNGIDHFFARMHDFGLQTPPGAIAVPSMGIGTIETHPIQLLEAFGTIANGGVRMPETIIMEVRDSSGETVYPTAADVAKGVRVISPQAAFVMTDILAGNTIKSQSFTWAQWTIYEKGERRPAGYKTGTTQDYRDTAAYGFLAPPTDPLAPALAVGVWMGNSNNEPSNRTPSLASAAPLWSRILTEISAGMPIADFVKPDGVVQAEVDAFSGLLPGPYSVATVKEWFVDGTVPTRVDDLHVELDVDAATGKLWQDGCVGPKVTKGFLDFSGVEQQFPQWQEYTQGWVERARLGAGVAGGPENTKTAYLSNGGKFTFGRTWGGTFAPTEICTPALPTCAPDSSGGPIATDKPGNGHGPATPEPTPCVTPVPPTPGPSPTPGPLPTPLPTPLPSLLPQPTA